MIKRFSILLFMSFTLISLCGCNSIAVFSSDSHKHLVSALGFEEKNGEIHLYAEALVVNSEDMNADKKRIIFEGSGNSPQTALNISKLSATENFDLSHCGIIAISNNLSDSNLEKMLDWCYNTDAIPLMAKIISCENPKKILESAPVSSVTSGYDILSLLEKTNEISGIKFKNSIFEVIEKSESAVNVFSLPFIAFKKDTRSITGISVFKNNSHLLNLDKSQMFLYSLITDSFSSGNVTLKGETHFIKSKKTTYKTEKTGNFIINISLENSNDIKKTIKKNLEDFIFLVRDKYGDVFGIGNIIEYQNPNLWKNIKNDFNKLSITVAVK